METKTNESLKYHLLEECHAMVKYLSADGKNIPASASAILNLSKEECCKADMNEQDVLKLHNELAAKISPARPKTICLLHNEDRKKDIFNFLGPVALVKRLMLVALISLFIFILISLSSQINDDNIQESIYKKDGFQLLIVLAFYLSASSLGAAFSNLFQANRHITNNNFDPKYETSYWIRYVLGIIAGFLLAVLVPIPESLQDKNEITNAEVLSKPLLAMLGGYSAALVYRVVFRLVHAIESIFIGKQSDQMDQKLAHMQTANEMDKQNERQKMVNHLLNLQAEINAGKSSDELKEIVKKTINNIDA